MSELVGILAPSLAVFGAYLWLALGSGRGTARSADPAPRPRRRILQSAEGALRPARARWRILRIADAPARPAWPWRRTACFAAGLFVVGCGVGFDDISLPVHMAGHGVIVAVGAPLLVLGRPVTLLLRSLPRPATRDLAAALRSAPVRRLAWPPLAFAAFVGAQLVFHLTPLFWSALHEEGLHAAEHLIFLVTALWLWSVCLAVEPLPGRWSPWARAGLLMAAMSASDIGSVKLMVDGYGAAGVAMLVSMMPLGLGAAAVAWTAVLGEERKARAREGIVHAAG